MSDVIFPRVGSWSKDDENSNENGKKVIGSDEQKQQLCTCIITPFIHFSALVARRTTKSNFLTYSTFEGGRKHKAKIILLSFPLPLSFFKLRHSLWELNSRKIHQHLTNGTAWKMSWNEGLNTELPRLFYGSVALRRGTSKLIIFGCLRQFSSFLLLFLFPFFSFHQRAVRHQQHPLFPAKFSCKELTQSDQQVLLQERC